MLFTTGSVPNDRDDPGWDWMLNEMQYNNSLIPEVESSANLKEFKDIESGRTNDRPNLAKAIQQCKKDNATLIIAKLDRLARNVQFIFNLKESGVRFQALDIPEANTLTLGIMASLAEHESELISQRTKAAIQAKRERDPSWQPGTPENLTATARSKGRSVIMRNAREDQSVRHAWHYIKPRIDALCTYQEIADGLNAEGYRTRKGKLFHPAQVRSIWLRFYD